MFQCQTLAGWSFLNVRGCCFSFYVHNTKGRVFRFWTKVTETRKSKILKYCVLKDVLSYLHCVISELISKAVI